MKKDPHGGLSAHRTSSTRFSKMQAFSRWEAACCSALATLTRLQAEKTKFRGACPRNFGNLTLFRRLRTAKLRRGLFPIQEIVLFLQGAILFRQTLRMPVKNLPASAFYFSARLTRAFRILLKLTAHLTGIVLNTMLFHECSSVQNPSDGRRTGFLICAVFQRMSRMDLL